MQSHNGKEKWRHRLQAQGCLCIVLSMESSRHSQSHGWVCRALPPASAESMGGPALAGSADKASIDPARGTHCRETERAAPSHAEAQSACHKFLMLPTHSAPGGHGGLQEHCKRLEASSKYDSSWRPPTGVGGRGSKASQGLSRARPQGRPLSHKAGPLRGGPEASGGPGGLSPAAQQVLHEKRHGRRATDSCTHQPPSTPPPHSRPSRARGHSAGPLRGEPEACEGPGGLSPAAQ